MRGQKGYGRERISRVTIWENHCGKNGTFFTGPRVNPIGNVTSTIGLAFQRFNESELV